MKTIKYILALIVGIFIFQACEINDAAVFDDKDAFISFRSSAISIGEEKKSLDISVLLTSLAGLNGTVTFEVDAEANNTAVEGVNYRILNDSRTLTFTKDEPLQTIQLELIDNDTFDGDVRLTLVIKSPGNGLNLGLEKTCVVTITDNEHPLLFILGTMQAAGESYYNGPETWNMTFAKDEKDISKIWISNLVNGGSSASTPVYGVVNEEKTEIRIPVNQVIAVSSTYALIRLEGFLGPDGDEDIPDGGYITGAIAEDGTITLADWIASSVYFDANASSFAGYYNVFLSGVTIKKVD